METSDGRPSSLAHSLSASSREAGDDPLPQRTAAEAIAQNQGAAGRLMTKEERRRLEVAIEKSESLEEIRRLEERLRLGYAIQGVDEKDEATASTGKAAAGSKSSAKSTPKKRKKAAADEEEDE